MKSLFASFPAIFYDPALQAFQKDDSFASMEFHIKKLVEEPHKINQLKKRAERISESLIAGGITGVVTSSMVIAVVWNISYILGQEKVFALIVMIGFAVLFANGFSLAFNDYLKKEEYSALYNRERRREKWECDNFIEGEIREMIELYREKGLSKEDSESLVNILSKDKNFFVDVMMKEELQMIQPDNSISSLSNAFILFFATVVCGSLPLLPFALDYFRSLFTLYELFLWSLCFTLFSLLLLGVAKSGFTVSTWWTSSTQLVAHGCIVIGIVTFATSNLGQYFKYT